MGPKNTTFPTPFRVRIQFALCRVRSLLLAVSLLISFPAGTKTFQFPALAYLMVYLAMSHSEILGSKAACASPSLIAACHVLHRF